MGKLTEDPEGRLAIGMRVRWRHSSAGPGDMIIEGLGNGGPLWKRPLLDSDTDELSNWLREDGMTTRPCRPDEPGARYQPQNLMAQIRYLESGSRTNAKAMDLRPASEPCDACDTCRKADRGLSGGLPPAPSPPCYQDEDTNSWIRTRAGDCPGHKGA